MTTKDRQKHERSPGTGPRGASSSDERHVLIGDVEVIDPETDQSPEDVTPWRVAGAAGSAL
jgi:hypothetical protein